MQDATRETKGIHPVSGYDFARTILNQSGNNAVEILLVAAHGGETDWLEKKAGVYPSAEHDPAFRAKLEKCPPEKVAEETKFYEAELLRSIACALVALHNSRGGVLFIGINDANELVPFETCDGDGILANEGLEAYVRKSVLGRLVSKDGLFRCKKANWTIPAGQLGVEARLCSYEGEHFLALLVPPLEPSRPPVLVTRTENNRPQKLLLLREPGDVGAVRTSERETAWDNTAAALANFHEIRERSYLSNTDLCGKLLELGIAPPPRKSRPMRISRSRIIRTVLAALAVLILAGLGVRSLRRTVDAPSEPDPLDPIREGIRSGTIHILTPEEAQSQVNGIQQSLNKATHGVLSDLGNLKAENRKNEDRTRRWKQWRDAEAALEQATENALSQSGILLGAADRDSPSGRKVRHFRENLSNFDDGRRSAEDSRNSRLGFGETNTETMLDTLLSEIKKQTDELRTILDGAPEISAEDENEWSRNGHRAEQSMDEIRRIRDSLH